ncbi:NADP-dependent oxidoreductase [Aeromicrobium chenweiae]|uniref:NADP-dependent oxidoreductase n=1 Tax=Aeromicrobium chenweiae TaxID=2079793 RepID=A0A2S0WRX7_9ACTN|nr:NADP-dependent oxidoreductase [Aeromicrobium chenweiae]AWB94105.1 NADP-dependent oxidoreductase [Aeromicrobium chenweiae]TGN31563.1 NADP-dependent oxidoreductase [Aeromicrobium chenweiae]
MTTSRRFVLAHRPDGQVRAEDFELDHSDVTLPDRPAMVLETLWVSLDPAIRGWLDDRPSYLPPVGLGDPVRALGLARVIESTLLGFEPGQVVRGFVGWQEHLVTDDPSAWELVDEHPGTPLVQRLGVLGMTGLTAWVGMMDIARPQAGETVVVSAAAGAVGSVAAQLAKSAGARVVGVAGGPHKGRLLLDQLGLDAVVDYRADDWHEQLTAATPDGVDVNFENVGGPVMEAVIDRFNNHARMTLCGLIEGYNMRTRPPGPRNFGLLLTKRIRMEGLIAVDHFNRAREVERDLVDLMDRGLLKPLETVVEGFDALPETFVASFAGGHVGKLAVRLGQS